MNMLIAYDAAGNIVATLDYVVARDEDGNVCGYVDFEGHEAAGGKLRDIWNISGATGSATWPEALGMRAHEYRVELDGKVVTALVHAGSGERRERATAKPGRPASIGLATPGHLPVTGRER